MRKHHSDFCIGPCTVYNGNGPEKRWCTPCEAKKGDCAWTKENIKRYLAKNKIKLKEPIK